MIEKSRGMFKGAYGFEGAVSAADTNEPNSQKNLYLNLFGDANAQGLDFNFITFISKFDELAHKSTNSDGSAVGNNGVLLDLIQWICANSVGAKKNEVNFVFAMERALELFNVAIQLTSTASQKTASLGMELLKDIYFDKDSSDVLKSINVVHAKIKLSCAAMFFYLGEYVKHLKTSKVTGADELDITEIFIAGNGAGVMDWLNLQDESAASKFLAMFYQAGASVDVASVPHTDTYDSSSSGSMSSMPSTDFLRSDVAVLPSAKRKYEVARGLIHAAELHEEADVQNNVDTSITSINENEAKKGILKFLETFYNAATFECEMLFEGDGKAYIDSDSVDNPFALLNGDYDASIINPTLIKYVEKQYGIASRNKAITNLVSVPSVILPFAFNVLEGN